MFKHYLRWSNWFDDRDGPRNEFNHRKINAWSHYRFLNISCSRWK